MADQHQPAPAPQPTLAQVVTEINKILADAQDLCAQVSQVKKVADNLSTQVTLLLQYFNNHVPTQGHGQAKKQQLPTPSTFDGSNWETWEPYIKAKLEIDGTAIGNSRVQFWYLYGWLDAKTQATVLHLANGDEKPEDILATLGRIYGAQ
jgi:hypothetical protein